MTPVRIGTCSFADDALVKSWYPKGVRTGEQRLRWYAERFDTVEIDSTYYRMPTPELIGRWAERVPDGFVFHIKAFAPLTRHPVRLEVLPPELRDRVEADARGRVDRMARPVRAEAFRLFGEALEPMRAAGKLGGILLQLAPYVVYREHSLEYLAWARQQLPGHDLLVEFRHRSWLDDDNRAATLAFLEQHGLSLVVVDAPRSTAKNLIPTVVATTSPTAYVRFHGRNAKTWNVRGGSAADRFDYVYPDEELAEWVEPMRELAGRAERVYALFNTNAHRHGVAQGPDNAQRLAAVLRAGGVEATGVG